MTEDIDHAIEVIGKGDVDLALKEYKNPLSVIGDCIRGMIIAAPGHTLIGGDFSGIEARVTAWIAQDEPALVMYRDYDAGIGPDPYIVTAGEIKNLDPLQLASRLQGRQAGSTREPPSRQGCGARVRLPGRH